MILIIILIVYFKDVKDLGKENLAISLQNRLFAYFLFVIVPITIGLLVKLK